MASPSKIPWKPIHWSTVRWSKSSLLQIYEMASDLCELQASQPDLLPQYLEQALVVSVAMTCDDGAYHAIMICSDMLWDILRREIVIWTAKLESLWYLMTCCDWVHGHVLFPHFQYLCHIGVVFHCRTRRWCRRTLCSGWSCSCTLPMYRILWSPSQPGDSGDSGSIKGWSSKSSNSKSLRKQCLESSLAI